MRLALLSDIHGNIAGLDAAFAYLHKLGRFDVLAAFALVEYDDRWVVRQYQAPYEHQEEK